MKDKRTGFWVALLSIIAVGAALDLRVQLLARYEAVSITAAKSPAVDPQTVKLSARAESLEKSISLDPSNLKQRWELADVYQQLHRLVKASEQLEAIARLD